MPSSPAEAVSEAAASPACRPVATIGLHGSASTWVFNVVRELLIAAHGDARVLALYAEEVAQLPSDAERVGRVLLIKSHHGSAGLDAWLTENHAVGLVSLRDPRDACLSMAQRFNAPLAATVRWIGNDCNRLLRLVSPGQAMLRYEDRFFEQPAVVANIAQALMLDVSPADIEAVFARYRTDAVRAFAASVADLPAERVVRVNGFAMDRVTQILAPHIGDTRSGKWRELPAPVPAELTRVFKPFLDRFGYPSA